MLAACLTPGILWLAGKFQLPSRKWLRVVAAHVAGAAVSPPSQNFAGMSCTSRRGASSQRASPPTALPHQSSPGLNPGSCCTGLSFRGRGHTAITGVFNLERLAASELQRQFASAQLQALRMQLQPHFLFNTLHTISGLIDEDKSAAERMIARLSDFLRMSLEAARVPVITLRDELRFVKLYLDIERVRFEDRLSVDFDIYLGAEDALVPAWILQPLVENAIRHGVAHREFDARITVRALRGAGELILSVEDNGPGNITPPPSVRIRSWTGQHACSPRACTVRTSNFNLFGGTVVVPKPE